MKRYDLNILLAFEALLSESTVSGAARRLGIGQPAMSASLARLRILFKDPLFIRTAQGMVPTARAQKLAGPLRHALGELRALMEPAAIFDPATARRSFRISGGDYVGMTVLPRLVARLRREAPGIDIRFRYVEKDFILDLLERDEIDIACAVMPSLPRRFVSEALIEETFVCAARSDHPLFAAPLTPAAFAACDHLLVTERADERGYIDDLLAERGLKRRVAVTVPSAALVAGILLKTDLIATIPRRAGERLAESDGIALAELPCEAEGWTMSMIWPGRNAADPGLRWIREQLRSAASGI